MTDLEPVCGTGCAGRGNRCQLDWISWVRQLSPLDNSAHLVDTARVVEDLLEEAHVTAVMVLFDHKCVEEVFAVNPDKDGLGHTKLHQCLATC